MKNGIKIFSTSPYQFPDCEFHFDGKASDSFTLDGNYVDQWNDLSGNGRHVLNASGDATRPTYDPATGRVTFVKANRTILQSAAFTALAQPNTVFIVYKINTYTNLDIVFTTTGDTLIQMYLGNFILYGGAVLSDGAVNTNDNIHCGEFNGATSKYFINSALVASGNAGASTISRIRFGSSTVGVQYCSADIMEVFGFNRRLSSGERTGLELYLKAKWSI